MSEIYKELVCIGCPNSCSLILSGTEEEPQVSGNRCKKGRDFALSELKCPMRTLTTTVTLVGGDTPVLPVRSEKDIPKAKISQAMKETSKIKINAPVECGAVVLENIAGTGVRLISTATKRKKA